ncbi:zonular occludens toxin domain-containing protein [Rugamonas sp. DEMB1]|uniref:zonular occludens toxin domain-containing protein n=1 Tax=Rugamonas sp. DEMB1 TaxID=3039386 RepID=UPI00244779C3|nr:zonular occludens toxin domain-containing protein [Rugamonas sp. DEMB1]WGG51338.1 zonular occludens toxin domain-containing protein [Rugamonas sp. DEMB1]
MAVYAITGKLGSGKGKAAIDQIRRYLRQGKRVATNCDVFLEHLMPERDRSSVIRIPDKPSSADLYMVGSGNRFIDFEPILRSGKNGFEASAPSPRLLPGFDESHNGALILDECGSWLNTRNFQDKGRAEMLEWAIHARKYGWDVFFIMQNIAQVDKQLRDSLLEYVVRLNRLDRMKVPVISGALKLLTAGATEGNLPRVHIGVVRLGAMPDALVADRWVFRGDDLNNAYNTTQVFSENYPHGVHCLLPAWHLSAKVGVSADFVGPILPGPLGLSLLRARVLPPKPVSKHMTKFLIGSMFVGVVLGLFGSRIVGQRLPAIGATAQPPARVYSDSLKGVGYFRFSSGKSFVTLSDGNTVESDMLVVRPDGWEAETAEHIWVRGTK